MALLTAYNDAMEKVYRLNDLAQLLLQEARRLRAEINCSFHLTHTERDPGFPCWSVPGVERYFSHPQDALIALEAKLDLAEIDKLLDILKSKRPGTATGGDK
jgi:hypothetical protein